MRGRLLISIILVLRPLPVSVGLKSRCYDVKPTFKPQSVADFKFYFLSINVGKGCIFLNKLAALLYIVTHQH